MGRNRPIPSYATWSVATTPTGRWLIVDEQGRDIFHHPDRLTRLQAVYLAAQAPPLLVAVEELARTVEYLSSGYHQFRPLLEFASLTITFAKPPTVIVAQVEPLRHQLDIDLEAA